MVESFTDEIIEPSKTGVFIRRWVELTGVFGLAVVQPTLSFFASDISSISPLNLTRLDILSYLILLIIGPAALLILIEIVISLFSSKSAKIAHSAIIALGFGVLTIEFTRHEMNSSQSRIIFGGIIATLCTYFLMARTEWFHVYLRALVVTPVIFAVIFAANSDVWNISSNLSVAPYKVKIDQPSRVVMVVFDELPLNAILDGSGSIDALRYPAFAELAESATFFRNLSTVSPSTPYAVPSLLSGIYPSKTDGPPTAASHPDSLFTLLGDTYEMNVHQTVESLCPANICTKNNETQSSTRTGLGGLLRNTYDFISYFAPYKTTRSPKFGIPGLFDNTLGVGKSFVSSLSESSNPRLDYMHVLMPHQPWHYFGDARDTTVTKEVEGTFGSSDKWVSSSSAELGRQRFLLQMQTADWLMQQILDRLKDLGIFDDSLVVVTADHGMAFTPGEPQRGVTAKNYPGLMWIPLLVKQPLQVKGAVDDRPAQTVDILPTIADSLHVKIPWTIDGISLTDDPRAEGLRPILPNFESTQPTRGDGFLRFSGLEGLAATLRYQPWARSTVPNSDYYRVGPFSDLFGRTVGSLNLAGGSVGRVNIDGGSQIVIVDPSARVAPWTYLRGSAIGLTLGTDLVISVNGRVVGFSKISRTSSAPGLRFWANLSPSAFKKGLNKVEVFSVHSGIGKALLARAQLEK